MGLSQQEFETISPFEFTALLKRKEAREREGQYNAALICSVLANLYRDPKKKSKPFAPDDFMPQKQVKKQPQTPEQMAQIFKIYTLAMNGEVH